MMVEIITFIIDGRLVDWLNFNSYFDIYVDFPFDSRIYPRSVEFFHRAFYHEMFRLL